jgi:predicted transglutaminase-like cysteine proteinase
MPKWFWAYLFLHVSLFGGEFRLSSAFFSTLSSTKSQAIFKDYERFMNETNTKSLHVKIEAVNFYINTIVPKDDEQNYGSEDFWASREEFLKNGGGDCEDYAIAKFYSLADLGVDKKAMALCIVREDGDMFDHMVLLLEQKSSQAPLVLDNLSFKVLNVKQRYDLHLKHCMNEQGSIKVEENRLVPNPSRGIPKNYRAMLERSRHVSLWQKR